MEIQLHTSAQNHRLYKSPGETYVYFAQAAWSQDESKVSILVTGMVTLSLAFDVRTGKEVSFDILRKEIASAISKTYGIPLNQDPVKWAATADGWSAFAKKFPGARSY